MDDWMPMSVWVEFIVFYSGSIMIVIGSIGEQFVLLLSEINVLVNLRIDDSYFINFTK